MRVVAFCAVVVLVAACGGPGGGGTGGGAGGGSTTGGGGGAATGGGGGGGATGGGGSATGGGGGATGGGGGATGGGGGVSDAGTGGGGASGGVVTFEDLAFEEPQLLSGPDGVLHMAWVAGPTPDSTVTYARCASGCDVLANWQRVVVERGSPWTSRPRLGLGPDGRVHLVFQLYVNGNEETVYGTCASNCTQVGSWSKVNITNEVNGLKAAWRGAPLVVDSSGRVSFLLSSLTTNATIALATCASGCTTGSNWSLGTIRTGGSRAAMAARGTTLHLVMHNDVNSLVYRTCASNCTSAGSWQESPPLFIHDGYMPTDIAVTASGGVRVAYNQGPTPANESPAIKAQDNKVLVWGCDANCLQVASWTGVILGDARDGEEGIDMVEVGGAIVLSLTNTINVLTRVCGSNCLADAANWDWAEIDSSTAIAAEYDPYAYGTCGASRPQFSAWYPDDGVVAVRPDGAVAFAHGTHITRTCVGSTSPGRLPGFGRLVYLP